MAQAHVGPSELADRANRYLEPDRGFDKTNVSHWTGGKYAPEPDRVIAIAKALGRDAIEALREAGHHGIAQFAADLRANPIEALITRELDAIEQDDPHLDRLTDRRERRIITAEEYARLREEHLEQKRGIILRMRENYHAELQHRADPDPPQGGNGDAAAM